MRIYQLFDEPQNILRGFFLMATCRKRPRQNRELRERLSSLIINELIDEADSTIPPPLSRPTDITTAIPDLKRSNELMRNVRQMPPPSSHRAGLIHRADTNDITNRAGGRTRRRGRHECLSTRYNDVDGSWQPTRKSSTRLPDRGAVHRAIELALRCQGNLPTHHLPVYHKNIIT